MPKNLEVKAKLPSPEGCRAVLRSSGAEYVGILEQTDTYFSTARGRLKLRETGGPGAAELIYYERPEGEVQRVSEFQRIPCGDPAALMSVLEKCLGIRGVVRKRRDLFMVGLTRVHVDEVEGLGSFIELETPVEGPPEGARAANESILRTLGVRDEDSLEGSYIDLLLSKP